MPTAAATWAEAKMFGRPVFTSEGRKVQLTKDGRWRWSATKTDGTTVSGWSPTESAGKQAATKAAKAVA
jgi:hypothetical protein